MDIKGEKYNRKINVSESQRQSVAVAAVI